MQSKKIFTDYDLDSNFRPQLIFRTLGSNSTEIKTIQIGEKLSWQILPEKYCIGYHSMDEYHSYEPCPFCSMIEDGVQCNKCRSKDVLFPCMVCDGSTCHALQKIKDVCDETKTSVYLVTFGGLMKVGVSRRERLLKRWIEQGADFASEIAVIPNGMLAREIESSISKDFEIIKGVRVSKKLSSITNQHQVNQMSDSQKEEYEQRMKSISSWIQQRYGDYSVRNPVLKDLSEYYPPQFSHLPKRLDISNLTGFTGTFLGLKGPVAFLRISHNDYVFDIRELRGLVSILGYATDDGIVLRRQSSMTDFFG